MNKVNSNREKKEKIVAELLEKVQKAKAMVFTNYQGLTHKQIEELKKGLKKADAELMIAKNTLIKRALQSTDYSLQTTELNGPTATVFSFSDPIAPLKELAKMIKALKLPTIKFGIVEGKEITGEEVLKLATLPSREVLLAQVVGGLKSPIFGLHRALNWNLQKLVMTLKVVETSKTASRN